MAHRLRSPLIGVFLFGTALFTVLLPAALGQNRYPTPPCPPPLPPCPPTEPDKTFEIRITSIDATYAAIPAVSAVLAGTSNREDQRTGLQAQAKRGVSISHISYGPTLSVPQGAARTRGNARDASPDRPSFPALFATRTRVTARPHLNAGGAEAVDLIVEQIPPGTPWTGIGTHSSLVFDNGDTKLVRETTRPDGTSHLVYATVFFPPR